MFFLRTTGHAGTNQSVNSLCGPDQLRCNSDKAARGAVCGVEERVAREKTKLAGPHGQRRFWEASEKQCVLGVSAQRGIML